MGLISVGVGMMYHCRFIEFAMKWLREMSYVRYSDSLRTGRFRARIPVKGEIFRNLPDRTWSPPSLLYSWYRVAVLGVKRLGRNHPLHLAPRLKKECSYTFTPRLCLHGLLKREIYAWQLLELSMFYRSVRNTPHSGATDMTAILFVN
jgi:hypothetical protein